MRALLAALVLLRILHAPAFASDLSADLRAPVKDLAGFALGADFETFATPPASLPAWLAPEGQAAFAAALTATGLAHLRLASMNRWDWRGREATAAQTRAVYGGEPWYPHFEAADYYRVMARLGVTTLAMLDVRAVAVKMPHAAAGAPAPAVIDHLGAAAREYAAGYAAYCKAAGCRLAGFEIGNEEYMRMDAESYARIALAYAEAVKAVLPGARMGFVTYVHAGGDKHKRRYSQWTRDVLARLRARRELFAFAVAHLYNDQLDAAALALYQDELAAQGFAGLPIVVSEWRHSTKPDDADQVFGSSIANARHLLRFVRTPGVAGAYVHAFPMFGGLAEWSDGERWTSYEPSLFPGKARYRADAQRARRWRVLPLGLVQKTLVAHGLLRHVYALRGAGAEGALLTGDGAGRFTLSVVNETARPQTVTLTIAGARVTAGRRVHRVTAPSPAARPADGAAQPWTAVAEPFAAGPGNSLAVTLPAASFTVAEFTAEVLP